MTPVNFGYKDELLATGFVLVLTVVGSFYFASQFVGKSEEQVVQIRTVSEEKISLTPDPAQIAANNQNQVLGSQDGAAFSPTPVTNLMQTIPTPAGDYTDVGFGYGGLYDFPAYKLELSSPRIRINKTTASSRMFVIDVVLTNNLVPEGLANRLGARIVKDGTIIADDAAMTVTPLGLVPMGSRVPFQASISLIEGTDVDQILYRPEGYKEVLHLLNP